MDKADGAVVLQCNMDVSDADKKLEKLREKIADLEKELEEKKSNQNAIAKRLEAAKDKAIEAYGEVERLNEILSDGYWHPGEKQKRLTAQLNEQKQILAETEKTAQQLTAQDEKACIEIEKATNKLDKMKEEAGGLVQGIAASNSSMGQLESETSKAADATEGVANAAGEASDSEEEAAASTNRLAKAAEEAQRRMDKFADRIKNLAKRVFVFSLITSALRAMKDWFGKVVKSNKEASAAIAKLKGALLTLIQPLVNVIIPAFTRLVNILTYGVTALSRVMSALFGATIEESADAAEGLYNEADALDSVGSAAKNAQNRLASFDEINKLGEDLNESTSTITPDFSVTKLPDWLEEWVSSIELKIKALRFSPPDGELNVESILSGLCDALTTAVGAVIGFKVGGIKGAVIGALIGVSVGSLVSSLAFDGDGKMNKEELLNSLIGALLSVTGAVLGFKIGGVTGAAIGVSVGAMVTALVSKLVFNDDGEMNTEELLSLLCSALFAVAGGVIGFKVAQKAGAAIGISVGATVGSLISNLMFDNDGKVSGEEIAKGICGALDALVGAVIGFKVGGPGGAFIGMTIGASATLSVANALFDNNGKLSGKEVLELLTVALGSLIGAVMVFSVTSSPIGAAVGITVGAIVTLNILDVLFDNVNSVGDVIDNAVGYVLNKVSPNTDFDKLKTIRNMVNGDTNYALTTPKIATGKYVPTNYSFVDATRANIDTKNIGMQKPALDGDSGGTQMTVKLYLDGRELAENQVVHINNMTRENGNPVLLT